MPFSDVYLFLWKYPFFSLPPLRPPRAQVLSTAALSLFFLPFFLSFSYMLSFSAPVFHYYVFFQFPAFRLMYMYGCPFPLKLFPVSPLLTIHPPSPYHSPTTSLLTRLVVRHHRLSLNPSHPWLLFSRRTYFINARPLLAVAPLDDR